MIPLVLAQLRARWGQALTLLVLSAAVTTAALTAPVYADAVDRATIATALAQGSPGDRVVSFPPTSSGTSLPPPPLAGYADVLSELPAFEPVVSVQINVLGLWPDLPVEMTRLVTRDGFCGYARFEAGRCPVGSREIALPVDLAERAGWVVGDQVALSPAILGEGGPVVNGSTEQLVVVGVFAPQDPDDPYWATANDLLGLLTGRPSILTSRSVLETWEHDTELVMVDAVLAAEAVVPERIAEIRAQLAAAEARAAAVGDIRGSLRTGVPRLLDQVGGAGAQARALLPVMAAPLVAVCWLVVYLAVGHGVFARRRELGVVALHGARPGTRLVVLSAESLLPVLAGVPVGLAATHLLVRATGPAVPVPFTVTQGQLLAAGLALVGSVVAVLLALRREVAAPLAQLLRRVPPRRRTALAAVEVLVVALAVVAIADVRWFDRELAGLWVVVPAVVMLAVALLVARLLRPLIDWAGRWTLRRGWLGPALAALYLARQPGAARLAVVLALVLGMLGLAMTSGDVAGQGRQVEAGRVLGADRVLTVAPTTPEHLLAAVRAADPQGRYAMAAVPLPASGPAPPRLAVDASRLATVATWQERYGPYPPEQVAQWLRPPAPAPVDVSDGELVAEFGLVGRATPDGAVIVSVLLSTGPGELITVDFGPLAAGERTYRAEVLDCPTGCRLAGLSLTTAEAAALAGSVAVAVSGLALAGDDLLAGGWLTETDRWRVPEQEFGDGGISLSAVSDGLLLSHSFPAAGATYRLLAVDAPYPLPVVTTGSPVGELTEGMDGGAVRVASAADLVALPGLPGSGVLMDLEYAALSAVSAVPDRSSQVWLAAGTPAEVVDQLEAEGLVIREDRTAGAVLATLDQSGAALALRFFPLAGGVAVLVGLLALGLVVAVERTAWRRDLLALRRQGLGRRTTGRAARWSYGVTVLAAVVAGALAVAAAWLAAGDRLPLGVDRAVLPPIPQWPAVLVPWAVVVAGLLVIATVAGSRMRGDSHDGRAG